MKSSKVQWLQRMGIDVWRPRTVQYTIQRSNIEESTQAITEDVNSSSSSKTKSKDGYSTATETDLATSSRKEEPTEKHEQISAEKVRIEVCCSIGCGLLLIKDISALDRDLTEDIFRAFHNLKGLNSDESKLSFFQFNWPAESQFRHVRDSNDASLESARQAFRAKARSSDRELPSYVVGIGKDSIQLADGELFKGARVLHSVEDPNSPAVKRLLWNFLRDDQ